MSILPKELLHEYVMQMQNILTLNIIQGVQVNYQLFTDTIMMLDILQWLNFTFKDKSKQIEKKEFHNDAVNNNVDLRLFMVGWAERTLESVKNGQPFANSEQFNPCEFTWLMTPHLKTVMLQKYCRLEAQDNIDFFLMRSFMNPAILQTLG